MLFDVVILCQTLVIMETVVAIRMSDELRKKLQALADADRRKLSDYIRVQLETLTEPQQAKGKK